MALPPILPLHIGPIFGNIFSCHRDIFSI